jgi:hypothetical protein
MSDIIERLEEAASFFEQPPPPKGNPPAWPIQSMLRGAVSEIAKLRAETTSLRSYRDGLAENVTQLEARVEKLTAALTKCAKRLERACIHAGNDAETAAEAVAEYRTLTNG